MQVLQKSWDGTFSAHSYGFRPGRCETPQVLDQRGCWLRRRVRSRFWKRGTTRYQELRKRGIAAQEAATTAGSSDGPWNLANSPALKLALSNASFAALGLPELTWLAQPTEPPDADPHVRWVWQRRVGDHFPHFRLWPEE